jgi:hypothetical protein
LAVSLNAGTILSDSLQLSYTTSNRAGFFNSSGTSVSTGSFSADGWSGSADGTTNVTGGSFSYPLAVSLTDVSVTCESEDGCGLLQLTYEAVFAIASPTPELDGAAPYSVSLTGSGPVVGYYDYQIGTEQGYYTGNKSGSITAGTYSFSTSGNLGPGNFSLGNGNVSILAAFAVNSANYGETISLPGSFDITVGAPDAPEPGTLPLISGALAIALGVWARRRQCARVR